MRRTIDGVVKQPGQTNVYTPRTTHRTAPVQAQIQAHTQAQPQTQIQPQAPIAKRMYAKPTPSTNKLSIKRRLQLPAIITGAMIAGFFAQSLILGEILACAYGVIALVARIPSRTTFTLALMAMVTSIFLLVVRSNTELAQNFATYTFLLLVAGVIALGRELKKRGGLIYSSRRTNIDH